MGTCLNLLNYRHINGGKYMKKIGAIFLTALALTIGGAYATFNYAEDKAEDKTAALGVQIADAISDEKKGVINVTTTSKLSVDDKAPGALKTSSTWVGETKVSFTPSTKASDDVQANGIKMSISFAFTSSYPTGPAEEKLQYDDGSGLKNIYKINSEAANWWGAGVGKLNDGNQIKSEITVDLGKYFTVEEFSLPTIDKYNAFKEKLLAISVTITIAEYIPTV